MAQPSEHDEPVRSDASTERTTRAEHRSPVVPDNGYSRESYAIHATRTELPLFSNALHGSRDDARWLSSLSGVLSSGDPEAAATAAQAAIERRRRRSGDSDSDS